MGMRLADVARQHCDCCGTKTLKEGKCGVRLPTDGRIHCIGGTPYQKNHGHPQRLADGIVFWSRHEPAHDYLVAVELKGGRVEVDVVVEQLQNGALVAERISADHNRVEFAAVLASNSIRSMDLTLLRRRRIRFRGQRLGVLPVRCGTSLADVFGRRRG